MYHSSKKIIIQLALGLKKVINEYNLKKNAIIEVKEMIKSMALPCPKLDENEVKAIKAFFKSRGYKLKNTYWHRYYSTINGEFHIEYIPEDIFRAIISPRFNQMRQWPALLDKNLNYRLFKDFSQPNRIVQNINGFFYVNEEIVNEKQAIQACNDANEYLVIKPTIDSGEGSNVETFNIKDGITSINQYSVEDIFKKYKKDFVVQEFVEQSHAMKKLNPTTLNTLRIMTYLREDGVHILSSVSRIGSPESKSDNFASGGIVCGIDKNGCLKKAGFTKTGKKLTTTHSGITLEGHEVPNYNLVLDMVKQMHLHVPYFRIISWDIGIDSNDKPLLVEYNTYYQSTRVHQIPNGPLFGKFTDEILATGLEPYEVYL